MSIKYNDKTNNREVLLAGVSPVDQILNGTSKNAIANKAVFNALKEKIDKTVSDLVNYYSKADVYNKAEVRALISTISTMDIQVVNALPTEDISTTTIYFLKPAGATTYDEYVYINNAWVKIGTTDLDLSQYVTNDSLTLTLGDYYTKAEITTLLTQYAQKDNVYDKDEVDALLDDKQDSLTFDDEPTKDSTNVVKSGGVYSAVDDVYKVMGQNGGGKNLNIYPYHETTETKNGITFTDNGDGTITANGTSTAVAQFFCHLRTNTSTEQNNLIVPNGTYIISGCPSDINGAAVIVANIIENGVSANKGTDRGNGDIFTVDGDDYYDDRVDLGILIYVYSGKTLDNVTFRPMLRIASDTDDTWQPYVKTNKQLTEDKAEQAEVNDIVNVYGAKNLLPFNLADIITNNTAGTWNGKTFTQTGSTLKFILNDDGSITVDGTANSSGTATLFLYGKSSLAEENDFKGMILSGCPSGGTTNGYSFVAQGFDTSAPRSGTNYNDLGSGVTIGDKDYLRVYVRVQAGVTVDNLTFYPMIRLASITDDTYEPYAKTNQQLTKDTIGLINNDFANGAVNILPPVFSSTVKNGVTFTVNSDGSVTANGTASDSIMYNINNPFTLETGKTYKWTGCPRGGTRSTATNPTYKTLLAVYYSDNTDTIVNDFGDGVKFTVSDKTITRWEVRIDIFNGYTCNNVVFKPMITAADMPNSDYNHYVPYAKSNKELTEDVKNVTKLVGLPDSVSIFDVLADDTTYSARNTYWKRAQEVTNGADNFPTLLGVGNDSIVRVDKYSKYYIGIEVNDANHGLVMTAWGNSTISSLKFVKINTATSPYVSQVTINKATT